MKADILAFGAHPDDIELSCAGTLVKAVKEGKTVVVADLTAGELGTRGNAELRLKEADAASKIMGIHHRTNLYLNDGFFLNDEYHLREVIKVIRHYKPTIILAPAIDDRHPDHGKAAKLIEDACFYSGLIKLETEYEGEKQTPHRPRNIFHYIQDRYIHPHFLVDISHEIETKMAAIKAYGSQFYNPDIDEPETYISSKEFMDRLFARNMIFGKYLNTQYAEGYTCSKPIGVDSIFNIL